MTREEIAHKLVDVAKDIDNNFFINTDILDELIGALDEIQRGEDKDGQLRKIRKAANK